MTLAQTEIEKMVCRRRFLMMCLVSDSVWIALFPDQNNRTFCHI